MSGQVIADIPLHSQRNCYAFGLETMQHLKRTAAAKTLTPGTYTIRIQPEEGGDQAAENGDRTEPVVLLWMYGGRFVNHDTGVAVHSTWCSLNGYDDRLTLQVLETGTLTAFFFPVYSEDTDAALTLSFTHQSAAM